MARRDEKAREVEGIIELRLLPDQKDLVACR